MGEGNSSDMLVGDSESAVPLPQPVRKQTRLGHEHPCPPVLLPIHAASSRSMSTVLVYLKETKNALIGNPTAKVELHREGVLDKFDLHFNSMKLY